MRFRTLLIAFLALCLGLITACSEGPANAVNPQDLTYDEILNTGLANKCPQISEFTRGSIPIEPGQTYFVDDLCLEPQEYFVKEEPVNKRQEAEYVPGKLLTRYTTSLEQISGKITVDEDGVVTFYEEGGIDFQPVTVQLPGGEQVPFFFTIKNLVGKTEPGFSSINSSIDFEGDFRVPSYRGATFLDPKGRGLATGYDNAVALPATADKEDYANVKQTPIGKGSISLQVTKVDQATGEIAGVFDSEQPSDTDLGAKEPVEVKIRGIFYARVTPEA
ncbi:photosystem II manganese-stabilizing polypeptide [Crocosphaera subtropica]|uniref:Photosystem II extrinsic protein O n=1 Tax=Crocosphaera subtropica (strain ATCC 51142 / BH68) TaxID=43989 RepID=PSBO_CROS5|nr:photosystem II manganese-stabilizing polypeptide [Crocosphaera subtropica]Q9R6W6.2 RecName: Full=Photosystem II extrinsic protein O; Short=PsbO; AltName: Full=Photosystem II manganese-stabilizing polypeptide; Short=MSP; Flags: Precursor [Crocosphaera subtropica ATCC 51142]